MALTYEESAALMNDTTFKGRVKVACLKFANYMLEEPGTTPAHGARSRWANSCILQPDATANVVTPPTVMDPAVQGSGSAIDDAALQSAVELVINSLI